MITREYLDDTHVIYQDDALYRFASDAVLLSRFATVKKGDTVADFCAGSGIVGLNLFLLHPEIAHVTLVELQQPLCALAARSVEENGFSDPGSKSSTTACRRSRRGRMRGNIRSSWQIRLTVN